MSERDQGRERVEGPVGGLRRGEVRRHKVAAAEVANEQHYEGVGGRRRQGRDADGVAGVVGWPPCRINTARAAYNYARPAPPPSPQSSRECRCAPSGIPGRHGASRRPAAGARKQPWRKLSGTAHGQSRSRTDGRSHTVHTRAHPHTRTPTHKHLYTSRT